MNVYEQNLRDLIFQAICTEDPETAAESIEIDHIPALTARINNILLHASENTSPELETLDSELIVWAASSYENFIWVSTFSQHLHFLHAICTGSFSPSLEILNKVVEAKSFN